MPSPAPAQFSRNVLEPADAARIEPTLERAPNPCCWVYRYEDASTGWLFSIATFAEPGSGKLSLGGFRIAPASRTELPGYDNDREAIELAMGMEEKIHWSRLLRVGGPHALQAAGRIVGGKCVLCPTADARVGQPRDRALLDFAIACLHDAEKTAGIYLTTGQDLGHGIMSDGRTGSLEYLHDRFASSVVADTSLPTAEGNFCLLAGMLRAWDIPLERARVGLIGAGHIGQHMLGRLREHGATVLVLESNAATRAEVEAGGTPTLPAGDKRRFLAMPLDAVVVNAAGGSLDMATVRRIAANGEVHVVCGSENLAMPDPEGAQVLLRAGTVFAPTELGGMMGYLTAVEEYLSSRDGSRFDLAPLLEAAQRLEVVGHEGTRRVRQSNFAITFEDAVREVFATR